MACSPSPFCISKSNQTFCRYKLFHYPKMRAQKFRDNGHERANNIVDANMRVLRERMEQVKKKETVTSTRGWDYKRSYEHMNKREAVISEVAETMGSAFGAIGFVFLSGSLCICLVSLLSHI